MKAFYFVCVWDGPDCLFVETETADGHGVGPDFAGKWEKHPQHDKLVRLGPFVLAPAPEPDCCEVCIHSRAEWQCGRDCSNVKPHDQPCEEFERREER